MQHEVFNLRRSYTADITGTNVSAGRIQYRTNDVPRVPRPFITGDSWFWFANGERCGTCVRCGSPASYAPLTVVLLAPGYQSRRDVVGVLNQLRFEHLS